MFTLGDIGELEIVTTSLVLANVFYILRKILGNEIAKELLRKLRIIVSIIPVTEKAVDLALLIKDFAPSRFRAINFFEQWKLASTREEKLAVGIAYQAAENSLHQDIPVAKYEELLWNRSLTTGILDIRSEETNGYLSVTTKNYSLLQAMTLQLGGYLAHKYEWRIEPPDLEEFWDYYKPHLHLQIINSSVV